MAEKLYELNEAWEFLRIKKSLGFQLLAAGRLKSVSIGRRRLVAESAIQEFVDSLKAEAEAR